MLWTYADAIELAMDMYNHGEISFDDLDRTATDLWQGMQADNEGGAR